MSTIPATPCVPPCVAVCPQAREMSRENVQTAVPLARNPGSRAPARLAVLLSREENGTTCRKDLGYDNDTVPKEFAGERPVCRRAPNPERGTRCATKPNTMRTHGIPSQPSVSRGRRGNGPKGPLAASGTRRVRLQDRCIGLDVPPRTRPDGPAARLPRRQPGVGFGSRTRAPCRSTSSELMCHAIPVSLTIEPRLSRW